MVWGGSGDGMAPEKRNAGGKMCGWVKSWGGGGIRI